MVFLPDSPKRGFELSMQFHNDGFVFYWNTDERRQRDTGWTAPAAAGPALRA
jgi:hypothetical protein